jgi:hypothetical protein
MFIQKELSSAYSKQGYGRKLADDPKAERTIDCR